MVSGVTGSYLLWSSGYYGSTPLEPGLGARAARDAVRALSPRVGGDRSLAGDIELVAEAIRDGGFVAAVEADVGELR